MNLTRFNARCYSRTKGRWGEDGDGDGDGDDPNEVQLDGDDDGDDFPPSGRNSPGRFLSARELFVSLLLSAPSWWRNISVTLCNVLGFRGDDIGERATTEGARATTPYGGAGQGLATPPHGVGPTDLHRRCPFAHKYLFRGKP